MVPAKRVWSVQMSEDDAMLPTRLAVELLRHKSACRIKDSTSSHSPAAATSQGQKAPAHGPAAPEAKPSASAAFFAQAAASRSSSTASQEHQAELAALGYGWQEYASAVQVMAAYNFYKHDLGCTCAVPGLDLANHGNLEACNSSASYDLVPSLPGPGTNAPIMLKNVPGMWALVAVKDIRPGEEITHPYHMAAPDYSFLLQYGFLPKEHNPRNNHALFMGIGDVAAALCNSMVPSVPPTVPDAKEVQQKSDRIFELIHIYLLSMELGLSQQHGSAPQMLDVSLSPYRLQAFKGLFFTSSAMDPRLSDALVPACHLLHVLLTNLLHPDKQLPGKQLVARVQAEPHLEPHKQLLAHTLSAAGGRALLQEIADAAGKAVQQRESGGPAGRAAWDALIKQVVQEGIACRLKLLQVSELLHPADAAAGDECMEVAVRYRERQKQLLQEMACSMVDWKGFFSKASA